MPAQLIPLACHRCRAPLQVPKDVRFVTCGHCQTSLSVEHEGDAYFTRQIDELAEKTTAIGDKVDALHASLERDKLDQLWETRRKRYLTDDGRGGKRVPRVMNAYHTLIGMTAIVLFAVVVIGGIFQFHAGIVLGAIVLGGLALLITLAGVGQNNADARRYRRAYREYQRQRAAIGRSQNGSASLSEFLDQLEREDVQ